MQGMPRKGFRELESAVCVYRGIKLFSRQTLYFNLILQFFYRIPLPIPLVDSSVWVV